MRVHARRYTVTESGTRHELPGGGLSADRVRELLKLVSNQTCGFVRVSYVNEQKAATKLRPIRSALYFLVTLQAPVKLHRIRNDQLYHYYRGDPLELLLLSSTVHRRKQSSVPISRRASTCSSSFPAAPSTPRA